MYSDRQAVEEYLRWLGGLVCPPGIQDQYKSLFCDLTERSFTSTVFHDENREIDGIRMRDKFAEEYLDGNLDFWIGYLPEECLILEMLVSLAYRMEWDFLHDDEEGDRTWKWFWELLWNLGINDQDDLNYDEAYVNMRLNILVDRTYGSNGVGGPFPLRHPPGGCDLRNVEIWYQMNWYISEKLKYGEGR